MEISWLMHLVFFIAPRFTHFLVLRPFQAILYILISVFFWAILPVPSASKRQHSNSARFVCYAKFCWVHSTISFLFHLLFGQEMVDVMGGADSVSFAEFEDLCVLAFLAVRTHQLHYWC